MHHLPKLCLNIGPNFNRNYDGGQMLSYNADVYNADVSIQLLLALIRLYTFLPMQVQLYKNVRANLVFLMFIIMNKMQRFIV